MYFFRNKFSCFDNLQLLGISVQFFNAEFMLRSITQKFLSINSPLNNFWVLKKWLHNYQEITTFNKWKSVKFLLPTKKIPSYICIHTHICIDTHIYVYTRIYAICTHTHICIYYCLGKMKNLVGYKMRWICANCSWHASQNLYVC